MSLKFTRSSFCSRSQFLSEKQTNETKQKKKTLFCPFGKEIKIFRITPCSFLHFSMMLLWCKIPLFKKKKKGHMLQEHLCCGALIDNAAVFVLVICQLDPCAQPFGSCCINLACLQFGMNGWLLSTKSARKHAWADCSAITVH